MSQTLLLKAVGPAVLLIVAAALAFGLAHASEYEPHRLMILFVKTNDLICKQVK